MNKNKFRGIAIEGDQKGNWVYGYYYQAFGRAYIRELDLDTETQQIYGHTEWEVDPNTVGQYIGKNDSKKQETYEGDIITYQQLGWDTPKLLQVDFQHGHYGVFTGEYDEYPMIRIPHFATLHNGYQYEIIGSMHKNPELIPLLNLFYKP